MLTKIPGLPENILGFEAKGEINAEDYESWMAWDKVALVTDVSWLRKTIQCLAFIIPGSMKLFGNDNLDAARDWIIY